MPYLEFGKLRIPLPAIPGGELLLAVNLFGSGIHITRGRPGGLDGQDVVISGEGANYVKATADLTSLGVGALRWHVGNHPEDTQ